MIKYSLKCKSLICTNKDSFDAWFQNMNAFEDQKSDGLITCPICGSENIIKSLTTPSLRILNASKSKKNEYDYNTNTKQFPEKHDLKENNIDLKVVLRTLKKEIEKNSKYVGKNFAQEARKMKEGKMEEISIYGHGTKKEIEELKDEGINVINIPWVADDH